MVEITLHECLRYSINLILHLTWYVMHTLYVTLRHREWSLNGIFNKNGKYLMFLKLSIVFSTKKAEISDWTSQLKSWKQTLSVSKNYFFCLASEIIAIKCSCSMQHFAPIMHLSNSLKCYQKNKCFWFPICFNGSLFLDTVGFWSRSNMNLVN